MSRGHLSLLTVRRTQDRSFGAYKSLLSFGHSFSSERPHRIDVDDAAADEQPSLGESLIFARSLSISEGAALMGGANLPPR